MYSASDQGRVRSEERILTGADGRSQRRKARLLKKRIEGGYEVVTLNRLGRRRNFRVHRLVLEAFVGPRPEGMVCRHGPRGGLDNRLENLSWGTHHENLALDRRRDGTHTAGSRNGNAILNESAVAFIRQSELRSSELAAIFGVSVETIRNVRAGRTWSQS
jgi:hypothetical protein